jgi:methylmalonyl-CoA/ethylmalonyl-CoA epimerase
MLICDHIGLVTHSLLECSQVLSTLSSFTQIGPTIHDMHQGVSLCFLTDPARHFPRLELLQPSSEDSPVWRRMSEGGGVHHICFQVESLNDYDQLLRKTGFTAVSSPALAPAFGNRRRVAFVHSPGLGLVEFVETPGAPGLEAIEHLSVRSLKRSFFNALS